jgi:hypothetical protein
MSTATAETREGIRKIGEKFGTDPLISLKQIIVVLCFRLQAQITALRDEKAHTLILLEIADEIAPGPKWKPRDQRGEGTPAERAARRLEEVRKRRQARGEL